MKRFLIILALLALLCVGCARKAEAQETLKPATMLQPDELQGGLLDRIFDRDEADADDPQSPPVDPVPSPPKPSVDPSEIQGALFDRLRSQDKVFEGFKMKLDESEASRKGLLRGVQELKKQIVAGEEVRKGLLNNLRENREALNAERKARQEEAAEARRLRKEEAAEARRLRKEDRELDRLERQQERKDFFARLQNWTPGQNIMLRVIMFAALTIAALFSLAGVYLVFKFLLKRLFGIG